ncbi:hypothetical protein OESDEN_03424 [Oesophagostomum dentatum]|uniref:Uncharacterized protein n=1 Tax=Oesophagostomum dentatum TaxID=61180 RepID=A0A0B1THA5_OESDE|nr:hypothetical protein OESDEN_03424 [Oesophagostomum dentatum]
MVKRQPISPTELLVRWSEFVAEFHTLENLEPAGIKLNFFQYYSLDVIAFLLSILLIVVLIVTKLIILILRRVYTAIGSTRHEKHKKA